MNFVSTNATAVVVAHRGARKPKRVLSTKAGTQETLALFHKYITKSSSVQTLHNSRPTPNSSSLSLSLSLSCYWPGKVHTKYTMRAATQSTDKHFPRPVLLPRIN